MEKALSERKRRILKSVIEEYMAEGLPVSSGGIQSKYFTEISSATIRAELSALEEMGYLMQPHTSAGRTPTALAYKYYVENFLPKKALQKRDAAIIDATLNTKFMQVEDVVRSAAKVISDVTNYTSLIVLNNVTKVTVQEIKLVGLDQRSALLIIITDSGIVRDKVITVANSGDAFLHDAGMLLNKIFSGKTIGDIKKNAESFLNEELLQFRSILNDVLDIMMSLSDLREDSVILEGESKLLEYPEASLTSAKRFLSIIDDRTKISEIVGEDGDIEFSIKIGKDETCGMEKCAIVTAKYKVNGKEIGHAGVIGPERMNYSKVISVLSYVGDCLDELVTHQALPPKNDNNDSED